MKEKDTPWINIEDQRPEEDQQVLYYFKHTGISIGHYSSIELPEEMTGKKGVYANQFSGPDGFLVDDVTHWMALPDAPEDKR